MKGVRARKDYSFASETDGIEIKKGGVTLLRKPSQLREKGRDDSSVDAPENWIDKWAKLINDFIRYLTRPVFGSYDLERNPCFGVFAPLPLNIRRLLGIPILLPIIIVAACEFEEDKVDSMEVQQALPPVPEVSEPLPLAQDSKPLFEIQASENLILGLDMNLIDLDPHLHFHMELLLYLDLAPDPFMLQPLLPLVPGKIPLGQLTRSGSVSPTNGSAPVFPTATPAICAWTRESRSTGTDGWYGTSRIFKVIPGGDIVTPIRYYSPAERLRLIARCPFRRLNERAEPSIRGSARGLAITALPIHQRERDKEDMTRRTIMRQLFLSVFANPRARRLSVTPYQSPMMASDQYRNNVMPGPKFHRRVQTSSSLEDKLAWDFQSKLQPSVLVDHPRPSSFYLSFSEELSRPANREVGLYMWSGSSWGRDERCIERSDQRLGT
ncbi:hypothetical protein Acr_00g0000370 [Actinidia rufa]|uniref:Uncharacterized protein n=1 Tax=Actinidia rufa TaxID=165716 RepID=A0A7J0D6Y6_9ERIC|nr:hypothetical protein Acr_00g0000370 [Actinidia rufa]